MTDNTNYVTPEEAKEIGCVMSMARDNPSLVYQTCLGPKCMAWRWKQMKDLSGKVIKRTSKTHGYCGMVQS